jgi:hypothetical protein
MKKIYTKPLHAAGLVALLMSIMVVMSLILPFADPGRELVMHGLMSAAVGAAVYFRYFTFYEDRGEFLRVGQEALGYGHDHLIRKEDIISADIKDKTKPWQYIPYFWDFGSRLYIQGSGTKVLTLKCKGRLKKAVVSVDEDFETTWFPENLGHLLPSQPTT